MSRSLTFALLLALLSPLAAHGQALPNKMCPVMPEALAEEAYSLVYEGRRIHFCCPQCWEEFKANPAPYLGNLDNVGPKEASVEGGAAEGASIDWLRWGLLGLFLVGAAAVWRTRRRRYHAALAAGEKPPAGVPFSHMIIIAQSAALIALGLMALDLHRQDHERKLIGFLQFATYADFGDPPIPKKPPLGPQLEAVFYRGNDERSEHLPGGGHYLTSTFRLRLTTKDGTPLRVGDSVAGKTLCCELTIDRAPYTPDFFFTKERMARIYGTQRTDKFLGRFEPVPDRVDLETLKPLWQWRLRFPIGQLPEDRQQLKGLVYVNEEKFWEGELVGGRMHYALQYSLMFDDHTLLPSSDIWMGALRRSPLVRQWRIPLDEWFSHEPIPALKRDPRVSDTLLGKDTADD